MLSTGFQMSPWPGSLYELNVGSMHCINPFDGVPFAAFESQLLIACGLPPDSCWMICQIRWASASLTLMPCLRSSSMACLIHSCTFPGGAPPAGGPPDEPMPPPPPLKPPPPRPPPPCDEPPEWAAVCWTGCWVWVAFAFAGAVCASGVSFHVTGWPDCGLNGCVFGCGSVENLVAGDLLALIVLSDALSVCSVPWRWLSMSPAALWHTRVVMASKSAVDAFGLLVVHVRISVSAWSQRVEM